MAKLLLTLKANRDVKDPDFHAKMTNGFTRVDGITEVNQLESGELVLTVADSNILDSVRTRVTRMVTGVFDVVDFKE